MFVIVGMLLALGVGVWVGLGMPGLRGPQDRIVLQGRPKRLQKKHIDWLRPPRR